LDVIINSYNDMVVFDTDAYLQGDDEHDEGLKLAVKKYKKGGPAAQFKDLIKSYGKNSSKESLCISIKRYKPKNKEEIVIHKWLLKGIDALESPTSIGYYYFPDALYGDMDGADAVNANDMFSYAWSFHDKVNSFVENWYESIAQNGGVVGPTIRTEYFPNKKPQVSASEKAIHQLAEFMDAGRDIYFENYNEILKEQYEKEQELIEEIYA